MRVRSSILLAIVVFWTTNQPVHGATNINPGNPSSAPEDVLSNEGITGTVPEGLTNPATSIMQQTNLIPDYQDWRNQLIYRGITFTAGYIGEIQANVSGGISQGVIYDGVLNAGIDLDLERITGFWKDADIHANALWIAGNNLSSRYVGDLSTASNIAAYNTIRLQELWLEQALWRKRITFRVGLLAADAEFFTSENSSLFINGTFGAFTFVGANLPDPPVYPVAAPGARFRIQPTSNFYFQAGVYEGDSGSQTNNNHGVNFPSFDRSKALIFWEAGYLRNQSPGSRGLVGTYKIGAFLHTGEFETWGSQARRSADPNAHATKEHDYGVYGVVDQEIYKANGHTIGGFVRAGGAPADVNLVNFYVDAGLDFTGWLPGRTKDIFGLAFARSSISGLYSDSQKQQGSPGLTYETVFEATYRINVAPWGSIQPDFQYYLRPSGQTGAKDAAVLGLRFTAIF